MTELEKLLMDHMEEKWVRDLQEQIRGMGNAELMRLRDEIRRRIQNQENVGRDMIALNLFTDEAESRNLL